VAGIGVIDMDRQEASLIVMSVEQRQLLVTVNGIGGVVDVEGDRPGWMAVAPAPQIHHGAGHADQRASVRGILPVRVSLARAN
jgi:hypothetical protein